MDAWTIGHSILTMDKFVSYLNAHEIKLVADVRRFPTSKRHPYFSGDSLKPALGWVGIDYVWLPELGGRRTSKNLSDLNAGWRVTAFHAYADYVSSTPGIIAMEEICQLMRKKRTAIMCAEALWTRCHRRLIADQLLVRAWQVHHILSATRVELHKLPDFAHVDQKALSYPRPESNQKNIDFNSIENHK